MAIIQQIPYYSYVSVCVDVILVYLLTYRLLAWLKRSYALDLIKGLMLVILVFLASHILSLTTLNWILERFATVLLIVVVVIFQPELRRFLERVGSTGQLFVFSSSIPEIKSTATMQSLLRAVEYLSREKIGAIIVLEGQTSLTQYCDTGIRVRGDLNMEMLSALFWPGSPTHDGAVIIKDSTIEAAGCFLPLTESPITDRSLGTRHRAALGLSEVTDAIIIVISEESGVISLVEHGVMNRYLTKEALQTRLVSLYAQTEGFSGFSWKNPFKSL
ncbi:TIGR00159 family protein [Candidatus Marinamargulisbacteria bacterium SCGC AG-333-B06]|nr:TIGR00159 family protein [Candidatus Marinamargulisbacteria bacterium SCGC AG-333-B06]